MTVDIFALLSVCVANLVLGVIIFLRNPRAGSSRAFLSIAVLISLWAATNYMTNLHLNDITLTNIVNRGAFAFAFLGVVMSLVFTYYFPSKRQVTVIERNTVIIIAAVNTILSATSYVSGVATYNNDQVTFSVGPLIIVYGAGLLILSLLLIRNLMSVIRSKTLGMTASNARLQAKFVLFGFGLSIFLGILFNLIIPLVAANWHSTRLGPFLTIVLVGTISYAIVRHKLFDIKSYVLRAIAYIVTLLLMAVIYIAPALYIMAIGIMGFPFEPVKFALGVLFATAIALYFENLRAWFNQITRKIFLRDSYDAALVLGELNKILVSSLDINSLLHQSSDLIAKTLKAEYCVFILNQTPIAVQRFIGTNAKRVSVTDMHKAREMAAALPTNVIITDYVADEQPALKSVLLKNDAAVLIKLSNSTTDQDKGLGYIILGFKRSGSSYNNKDATALEAMADVITIAIQNALRFEEIQNFNITLQQRVEEATAQLRRTNAKLEALDETKDDFISMASHQLRTPLTAVKGYLSMVLEGDAGKLSTNQRKMLGQAFISSQRMVFLIADLLNVSRLKTGKFVIERTRVDLANLIDQEIGQLRETAAAQSLDLQYAKPKNFPLLMLDETKTRQVVMNFIDNAIHYTPSGGHITVELSQTPQSIELRVRDNGIGVPKAEQHHLFTKFYRAVNARRERPDGTGLGLFMAKKVIIAQGGAVVFDSRENKGSVFGFTIPKAKILAPAST